MYSGSATVSFRLVLSCPVSRLGVWQSARRLRQRSSIRKRNGGRFERGRLFRGFEGKHARGMKLRDNHARCPDIPRVRCSVARLGRAATTMRVGRVRLGYADTYLRSRICARYNFVRRYG